MKNELIDNKNEFISRILTDSDYYAFGMGMPGRTWIHSDYRYAFNGKEKSSEISHGDYDFEARMFEGKIGRFMTVDPHQGAYPSLSPYSAFYNNPVLIVDDNGMDNIIYIVNFSSGQPGINVENAAATLQNSVDQIMGIGKVKVVVITPAQFDKTKLDPSGSDVVIAYGDVNNTMQFVETTFPGNCINTPTQNNPENSDPIKNVAVVVDNFISPSFITQLAMNTDKETSKKPGNSAQDALVLTLLHSVGHMTRNEAGHSNDNSKDDKKLFDKYGHGDPLFIKNFMLPGDEIINIIAEEDSKRDRYEMKLKSFKDFYTAPWNKVVFKDFFLQDFKKSAPVDQMPKKTEGDNKGEQQKNDGTKKVEKGG